MGIKARGLLDIGFKQGPVIGALLKAEESAKTAGVSSVTRKKVARVLYSDPLSLVLDVHFGEAASLWHKIIHPEELYTFDENELLNR